MLKIRIKNAGKVLLLIPAFFAEEQANRPFRTIFFEEEGSWH